MTFQLKQFSDLTNLELHEIYKLRSLVFVVEQKCAYQDIDEVDLESYHVILLKNNILVGYCRIIPPNIKQLNPQIGRVVTRLEYRAKGVGLDLMNFAIKTTLQVFNCNSIIISAQTYLLRFYESLGFKKEGEEYLEDGIPHIKMSYSAD